jgi:hypothetical protein
MFQPQPTPYSPFSSTPYGIGTASPASTFPGFQPSGLAADSRGPTVFRDPIFSPASNVNAAGLNFSNNNNLTRPFKMEGAGMHDLEAQEALARDFQPALEVGRAYIKSSIACIPTDACRVRWWERRRAVMPLQKSTPRQTPFTLRKQLQVYPRISIKLC